MPPKQSRKPSAPPARSKPTHQEETPSPKKGFSYPTQSAETPKRADSGRKSVTVNQNAEEPSTGFQLDPQRSSGFAFPSNRTPDNNSSARPSTGRLSTSGSPGTLSMAKEFVATTVAGALNFLRREQEPEANSLPVAPAQIGRRSTGSANGNGGIRSRSKSKPKGVVEEEESLDPLLSNTIPVYDEEGDNMEAHSAKNPAYPSNRLSEGPLPPRASVVLPPQPPVHRTTEEGPTSSGSGFEYSKDSPQQRKSMVTSPRPISSVKGTPRQNIVGRASGRLVTHETEPAEDQEQELVWVASNSGSRQSTQLGIQTFVADGTQSAQKFLSTSSSKKSAQGGQVTPQQFLAQSQVSGGKTVVMSDSGKKSFTSPNYGTPPATRSDEGVDRALDLPFPSADRITQMESGSPVGRPSIYFPKASMPVLNTANSSSSPIVVTRAGTPKRSQQTPSRGGKTVETNFPSPAQAGGLVTPQNRTASAISRTSTGTSAAKVVGAPFSDSTTQFPSPAPAAHYIAPPPAHPRVTGHVPIQQFSDFSSVRRFLVRLLMVIGILGCLVFAFVISLEPFSDHWKRVLEQPSADQRLGDDSADTPVSFPMVLEASKLPSVQRITQLYQAASHRAEGRAHCSQCITPRLLKEEHRAVLNEMGFNNDDQLREYVATAANQGGDKELARLDYILESLIILHQRIRVVTEVYDAPVGASYWKRFQHFQEGLVWLAGGSLRSTCLPRPHTIFWSAVGCMSKALTELPCPPVELRLFYYQGNYSALLNDIASEAQAPLPAECRACI